MNQLFPVLPTGNEILSVKIKNASGISIPDAYVILICNQGLCSLLGANFLWKRPFPSDFPNPPRFMPGMDIPDSLTTSVAGAGCAGSGTASTAGAGATQPPATHT